MYPLRNVAIAELLARAAEQQQDRQRQRALRRASRAAFMWQVEAEDLVQSGEPLTVLPRVGPWIASEIERLAVEHADAGMHPPPLRAGFLTWMDAARGAEHFSGHVRGDLQSHSTWSDGHSSVDDMARAAHTAGYEYLLLSEHTKGLPIAKGLDEDRLRLHWLDLERVMSDVPIRLLRGVEMNIDGAGAGDMDASVLQDCEVILGAFHSALRRKDDQTERYLAALRNPWVDVLAHPRCRIYNFRPGLSADWRRVFEEAARLDKAIEVDGYPDRQDVDVELLRMAVEAGARISFGSDAHHVIDLDFINFSRGAAGMAGVPPERVINCMPAGELVAWAASHRRAGAM